MEGQEEAGRAQQTPLSAGQETELTHLGTVVLSTASGPDLLTRGH